MDPHQLDRIVDDQQMERQLFTDAEEVTDLLRRYYREQGYLAAEIDRPRYEYVGATANLSIPVREGPRFTVGRVSAEGNHALENDALLQQIPLTSGAPFQPSSAEQSLDHIDTHTAARLQHGAIGLRAAAGRGCRAGRRHLHR